ncbi:MAG: AAA family ATPase [Capsulimonadaceae bacterium]
MKLDRIRITNYRCFENLSVPLEDDVTLLVGINGAGKSTILDAIAVALYDIVAENGGGKTERSRRKNKASLEATDIHIPGPGPEFDGGAYYPRPRLTFVQIHAMAKNYYPVPGFSGPYQDGRGKYLEWENTITYSPPFAFSYVLDPSSTIREYFKSVWREIAQNPNAILPLPAVAYYRSDRRFMAPAPVSGVPSENYGRDSAYEDCLVAGASYDAAAGWFFLVEYQELRQQSSSSSLSPGMPSSGSASGSFQNYEHPVLRRVREAVYRAFTSIEWLGFDGMPPSMKVRMKGGRTYDISQLSDGYRVMLGLIVDFARRLATSNPNSPSPLDEPGILVIDEIDLHLHPGWQQTVVPRLRDAFPGTQIIAATHSPQVLTAVEGRCVRILRDGSLYAAPASTSGAESKRVLEDVFGVSSRPPKDVSRFVRELENLFDLISRDELDAAKATVDRLKGMAYGDDPAILEAEISIENRLWEKGEAV